MSMITENMRRLIPNEEEVLPAIQNWIEEKYIKPTSVILYNQFDDYKNYFESQGSGSLIRFNNQGYLITAAHCLFEDTIDGNGQKIIDKIWISPANKQEKFALSNSQIFKQIYLGNHQSKDDDIAIFQVVLPNCDWFFFSMPEIHNLSMQSLTDDTIYYGIAVGYPANRNQRYEVHQNKATCLRAEGIIHTLDNKILEQLGAVPDKNIVLYRGYGKATEKNTMGIFIDPAGLSGGALFTILLTGETMECHLSGLIIESIMLRSDKRKNFYILSIPISEIFSKLKEIVEI